MADNFLWTDSDWNFPLLEKMDAEIRKVAEEKFKLDTYPNQIEIISADQMLSAYSSHGIPVFYDHWSFGKKFISESDAYKNGYMGLAYEIVINSSPCINYLMEENTATMQALVIAHAAYGHNSFFKGNYCFREWTDAESIIDYFIFARNYIRQCEEKYGYAEVEEILDSCHALQNYGIDRYKKPTKLSFAKETERQKEREDHLQSQINELWDTLPKTEKKVKEEKFPSEPTENILYFIEKNSPVLKSWQRELVRIVRKTATYFYPQMLTKVMNEGWATYHHYEIMQELYAQGRVTDGAMIEFLKSHSGVIYNPAFDSGHYSGLNVYTMGFNIFRDIKRMCEEPTEEDKRLFPDIAGADVTKTLDFIMRNFRDESFILQYLSPKVIRDMQLFLLKDEGEKAKVYGIDAIHDEYGYDAIRRELSKSHNPTYFIPNISVDSVERKGNRSMHLKHNMVDGKMLSNGSGEVLKHVKRLWGFKVTLESVDQDGKVQKAYSLD